MIGAKLPGPSVTRSGNWLKCAETSVAPPKRSGVEECFAHIDDGDREPEGPGQSRDGRGIVSGAEDYEVGRRGRDLEEELGAADRARSGLRVSVAEAAHGARATAARLDAAIGNLGDGPPGRTQSSGPTRRRAA